MERTELKDFFGTPALDYGSYEEMVRKYKDKIFVHVTDGPFKKGYVLFLGEYNQEDMVREWASRYEREMRGRTPLLCRASTVWGEDVMDLRAPGFMGGAGVL